MASDYDRIRAENIREYGEGTRHLAFLGKLYSERTHFIFELLQNAEDANATRIWFRLFPDRLEIEHDGRDFTESDVRGICGVGEGTKSEDLTKIGKFGIGFKSIYAYTRAPEVHCRDEHFRIEHYVRPYSASPRHPPEGMTTLFVLPFSSPHEAFSEIAAALRKLEPRTLLFLRHIELLGVEIEGKPFGRLLRNSEARTPNTVFEVQVEGTGSHAEENWLIFQRPVTLDNTPDIRVEIAFCVRRDPDEPTRRRIASISESPLFVFFPTDKPTNLGFLVQGPYRTTPARDNIPKDDQSNRLLVNETATLVVEALEWLRDNDLLTVEVLNTLPLETERFPQGSMFHPIFSEVRHALRTKELLPAYREANTAQTFRPGVKIRLAGSAELRKLLSPQQLAQLAGVPGELSWVTETVTADRTPALWKYIRQELQIEEIDPEVFVRRLTHDFLSKQSDVWLVLFYAFLHGQRAWLRNLDYRRMGATWQPEVPFLDKPIIRLEDGSHINPFTDEDGKIPAAYLPIPGATLPTVKAAVASKKEALDLLTAIGFRAPDLSDHVLENILPKYKKPTGEIPASYDADLAAIIQALQTDSEAKKKALFIALYWTNWVLVQNAAACKSALRAPSDAYFRSPDLELYFAGNSKAWFIDPKLAPHSEALTTVRVSKQVRVRARPANYSGFVSIQDFHGSHERGLERFDPEATIDGLEYALASPTLEKSRYVWQHLLLPNQHLLKGTVEYSSRQDFLGSKKSERFSNAGKLTTDHAWLYGKDAKPHRPSELTLADLPPGFNLDERLAKILGMRLPPPPETVQKLAEAVGISLADVEYLKQHRSEFDEFKQWQASQKKPKRPEAQSANPERREERVAEQARTAQHTRREIRQRQVRVNWTNKGEARTTLVELNTNEDGQMICQICGNEMPFKLDNGDYYFEAAECVKGLNRELPQNYIALCPVCAAKYQHANGTPAADLKQRILDANGSEIPVTLAQVPAGIVFTKVHLQDLQTAIRNVSLPYASTRTPAIPSGSDSVRIDRSGESVSL